LQEKLERDREAFAPRMSPKMKIAVLVPCYNEEQTIAKVVSDFRRYLPDAIVYVCDNNSTDLTREKAEEAGAVVSSEGHQGKGNVIRRMFADIDADVYIMVDGDDTYDASLAPQMLEKLVAENLDMINGARETQDEAAYRAGHKFGNMFLTGLIRLTFGDRFKDMLSGYRVMSRRFVKSFPALSDGFEIETELTVHALRLRMPTAEVQIPYYSRPEGSTSKLNTFRDGFRILRIIGRLVRDEKPLQFFCSLGLIMFLAAITIFVPILFDYFETGLVPRFPSLFASIGLMILAALSCAIGLILDTLSRFRLEQRRLAYLSISTSRRVGA